MSRTQRNRNTTPPGWEVRDDGICYLTRCCATKAAHHEKNYWSPGKGVSKLDFYRDRVLCECSGGPTRFRFLRYFRTHHKERKAERNIHYRQYRAKVKNCMSHEQWEDIPRFRRTSGWLSW